jgi:hydrogenase maturation protease
MGMPSTGSSTTSPRRVVLGVGNPIMTDDRVGLAVVEALEGALAERHGFEVRYSERGGLDLMDLLDGADYAVVVDAYLLPGTAPGTVVVRNIDQFKGSHHLYAAHGVDLPTAVEMGRLMGADMPDRVDIVGVVVEDPYTVSEQMTPAVASAVEAAVAQVLALLDA